MTARHVLLVVNPSASGGRARGMVPGVVDILRSHDWDVQTHLTESAEHAVEIAAGADPEDLVAALGGDGLVARVAEGALRSGALVAPLPAGRGSDFIRALGGTRDLEVAASGLPFATERRVDVGMAGGTPFLGVATVGYDSTANDHANNAPGWMPGGLVYAYGGARALLETRSGPITMTVDGATRTFEGWSVAIGNSGRYGAGMRVNPEASMSDGALDVTTVEGLPRWRYPALLPRLFRGTHVDGVDVRAARGAVIEIAAPSGATVYADGDVVGRTPMTFTVRPQALRVLG